MKIIPSKNNKLYDKQKSFVNFYVTNSSSEAEVLNIVKKVLDEGKYTNGLNDYQKKIINNVKSDLNGKTKDRKKIFKLTPNIIDEIKLIENLDIPKYLFHRYRYLFLLIVIGVLAPYIMKIIELLDFYRYALYIEDGGTQSTYVSVKTLEDFIVLAFQSGPYFLLKPLPWETINFLQSIQSIENILITMFLSFILIKSARIDKNITLKWFVYLMIALSIYGLVVFNFGSGVRYKFPFILIVVVGLCYEIYFKHGKLILNRELKNKIET